MSPGSKSRRDEIFVVVEMKTPQLRRSDIGPEHAAPPGLGGFKAGRFYKDSAPTELPVIDAGAYLIRFVQRQWGRGEDGPSHSFTNISAVETGPTTPN